MLLLEISFSRKTIASVELVESTLSQIEIAFPVNACQAIASTRNVISTIAPTIRVAITLRWPLLDSRP